MKAIISKIERRIEELENENKEIMDMMLTPDHDLGLASRMLANSTAMLELNRIKLEMMGSHGE